MYPGGYPEYETVEVGEGEISSIATLYLAGDRWPTNYEEFSHSIYCTDIYHLFLIHCNLTYYTL